MRFIKATYKNNGQPVWLNMDNVSSMAEVSIDEKTKATNVVFSSQIFEVVAETPEALIEMASPSPLQNNFGYDDSVRNPIGTITEDA